MGEIGEVRLTCFDMWDWAQLVRIASSAKLTKLKSFFKAEKVY